MLIVVVLVLVAWVAGSLLLAPVIGRVLSRSEVLQVATPVPDHAFETSGRRAA